MPDALRTAMKPLPKRVIGPTWKVKVPKGVISQSAYETSRGKALSFKSKG